MKFYIFANDVIQLDQDVAFKFKKRELLLKKGYPVDCDEILPVGEDLVESPNRNSRCINVGAHGTVQIKLHRWAEVTGKGNWPEWIAVPVSALTKLPGESTGGSIFISARIHGN